MWKYVAFVLLIILCAPAVLGVETNSTADPSPLSTTVPPSTADPPTPSPTADPTTTQSPPAPTTTQSPPAPTTTQSPPAPTTTQSPPATTTQPTSPPVTSPTTVPPTTSEPTTTTALPPPSVNTYVVIDDHNSTCIRAELAVRVVDPKLSPYNFVNATTGGSSCGNTTQSLRLTDHITKNVIDLTFKKDGQKYYVHEIIYGNESAVAGNTSGQFFSASDGKSYLCKAEESVKLSDNTTLIFSSVQIQAFGANKFGLAEECDADDKVGDIVPIAVGCALGALVVIVLIAYLVGRRRSRQRGYQSV